MKVADYLQRLHWALDDVHAALAELALDDIAHPRKENAATVANIYRALLAADDVTTLFEIARGDLPSDPTPENMRSLARAERRLAALFGPYEPAYHDPTENDDGRHAYH